WLSPAPEAVFLPGADINLQVAAGAATGLVHKVDFYRPEVLWDRTGPLVFTASNPDSAGHFNLTITNAPPGWYHLTARATADNGEIGQAAIEFRACATNDNFSSRIQLGTPNARVALNLAGMSLVSGEEVLAPPGVEATAWYTWTAPNDGFLY